MANICTTEYKITGTENAVKNLWDAISLFNPNDSNIYLHKLAEHYGIDYEKKGISVRGHIYFAKYDEESNVISMDTESDWSACDELFDEINHALDDELSISYREMECGCDIFYVKDEGSFFTEECCVDSQGEPFDGVCYEIYATTEEAIEEWCKQMGIERGDRSTEAMVDYINDYEYEDDDTYYYIHPFTFE